MRYLCILAAWCALAQQPAPANAQRAAAARQREAARRQAEAAGATLLPSVDGEPSVSAPAAEAACDPLPNADANPLIESAAKANEIKSDLIRAVISRESAFRPCAVSVKGAQGLMQLMPTAATQFGVTDAFDPKQNIEAGARYLKQLLEKYKGDVRLALAAYNAGPATVDSAGGVPAIAETQEYVKAIIEKLAK